MALRSGISSIKKPEPAVEPPADTLDEQEQEDGQEPEPVVQQTVTRGRVTAPPAASAPSKAPVGRPRLSEEQKQAAAEAKASKPRPAPKPVKPGSVKDIRAELRTIEAQAAALKESVAIATAKFQPKIDALMTEHAVLSAALASALFK